jgi:cardiolipin synthase
MMVRKTIEPGVEDADPAMPQMAFEWHGHECVVLPDGSDRYAALLDLISGATRSLKLVFYMFQPDAVGTAVRDALVQAASRGIDVHLIIDAFGSDAPRSFFKPLVKAGGRFDRFLPHWNVRYLIRNHQKIVLADGDRVMTGGFNIAKGYFARDGEPGWRDLAVLLRGPVVGRFGDWFEQLVMWLDDDRAQFRAIRRMVREWDPGSGPVQMLLGGPTRLASNWARRVEQDLAESERLDLVMAYFAPPRAIRKHIEAVAGRGRARLVLPAKSDNGATIAASRSLYRRLLKSGVSIAEYQPSKLHMKLIVMDDVTYIGSANLDMRSVRLNLEHMLRIEDSEFAEAMRGLIDRLESHSKPITAESHRSHASWFNRCRWKLALWLVSVVDYTIARRLNLGL